MLLLPGQGQINCQQASWCCVAAVVPLYYSRLFGLLRLKVLAVGLFVTIPAGPGLLKVGCSDCIFTAFLLAAEAMRGVFNIHYQVSRVIKVF